MALDVKAIFSTNVVYQVHGCRETRIADLSCPPGSCQIHMQCTRGSKRGEFRVLDFFPFPVVSISIVAFDPRGKELVMQNSEEIVCRRQMSGVTTNRLTADRLTGSESYERKD